MKNVLIVRLTSYRSVKREFVMKITSSNIQMLSSHQAETQHKKSERLNVWIDKPNSSRSNPEVSISEKALQKSSAPVEANETENHQLPGNIQVLKLMLEKVFGKKFELFNASDLSNKIDNIETPNNKLASNTSIESQRAGYGIEYDYHESYQETESTKFSATGQINTADGQTIRFSVNLNMSRQYSESLDIRIREGDAKLVDPLVLNFSGNAAELSQTKFSFDLNADGKNEDISLLKSHNAFLALDRNGDGKINNGSELFGALTGDGFSELSQYDEDNNQFIDSNDAVYNKLQVWNKNESGEDSLIALADLNIGAIYLDNIVTSFNINTEDNQTLGKIQSTSLYFNNSGEVGTIQKLDFVV